MQNRAVFGDIDLLAAKHRLDAFPQVALLCQLSQQLERVIRNSIPGVIEINASGFERQPLATGGIIDEESAQVKLADRLKVCRQGLPGTQLR